HNIDETIHGANFQSLQQPHSSRSCLKIMSFLELTATVTLMLVIRFIGKRRILLFCVSILFVCSSIVAWYGFTFLPFAYTSFNQANREPYKVENEWIGYIPFVCLLTLGYFTTLSITRIPWMLLSELFPFKSRGIACGVASAIFFVFAIIGSKTYYDLETAISLPGVSIMHACISFIGLILMYNILPETENITLEDIELHFSDNSKRIIDRKIATTQR
ncbi:facilitated trehalose transporter Tret1-1-like, partial [Contarinia nasturtii]|uniref:facilitated trehalose transporter Tret1-1-like n=1 Tax=Contarinia nasturtii TaxID=265458 RepID=UPI0012D48030